MVEDDGQVRIAVVLLVDGAGRVLLQERDEHAPRAANQWGMVGGHVEPGEGFEAAAYRELAEETGVVLPAGSLHEWRHGHFRYADLTEAFDYTVWVARVDLRDEDIVVGEGRQIVFVAPGDVPALDTAESCAHFVPAFLGSDTYRTLVRGGAA
ncbi:MAG TPA: NUDIX hydrolase [Marmoricola sp.]|nr:NUDIX hydrolase [Marmoricola sp.]